MSYFVEKDSYDMPVAYKIYWIFHNISLNAAPVISVVYWLVVFGKELQKKFFFYHNLQNKTSRSNFLISLRSTFKKE